MRNAFLVVALLCGLALAGCSSGPAPAGPSSSPSPVLVTRPGDYSADANLTNSARPHLHDYWGGKDRLVIVNRSQSDLGPGLAAGQSVPVQEFRPPSDHVVPQGTAHVEVKVTWVESGTDIYTDPELWVKTAAQDKTHAIAHIKQGQVVAMNTTNNDDDLPHQLLSTWIFEFRLSERPDVHVLRFKGNVTMHVEAVRGLEIPLYPGHPDRWEGRQLIELVNTTGQMIYVSDPGDGGCDGVSCSRVIVPKNGTIVPPGSSYVEATLTSRYGSPTKIGLGYHGAEGREFQRPKPTVEKDGLRIYDIDVGVYGDGPYAKQSQWEFQPYISDPLPDGAVAEEYALTVVVHRAAQVG